MLSVVRQRACRSGQVATQSDSKGAPFLWTPKCSEAFQELKKRLIEAPILCYPDFTLKTDASAYRLGVVLSQLEADGLLHPVAYASRALSPQEKRYAITELETLAVVWAVSHFHAYLYGHNVHVFADHSVVKAVLETYWETCKVVE